MSSWKPVSDLDKIVNGFLAQISQIFYFLPFRVLTEKRIVLTLYILSRETSSKFTLLYRIYRALSCLQVANI